MRKKDKQAICDALEELLKLISASKTVSSVDYTVKNGTVSVHYTDPADGLSCCAHVGVNYRGGIENLVDLIQRLSEARHD